MIPYEDFGGTGPVLHFAHPNAYPPGTFRQFLEPLTDGYHVLALAGRPLWSGSRPQEMRHWQTFADDLNAFLDEHNLHDVIGVGHSLGAVSTMLAARRQPRRFRALVLIEPVFMPRELIESAPPAARWLEHKPLAESARRRRRTWPSREDAFAYFRGKDVFRSWSDEALWDYMRAGLRPDPAGGVTLAFPPEWEARIYGRIPLNIWQEIPHVTQPTLAIRAAGSDTLFPDAWRLWQTLQPAAEFVVLPGLGHMAPMEQPQLLAETVLAYLRRLPPTP